MELFEYQAKSLLSRFLLPFSPYFLIEHEEEALQLYQKYGLKKGSVSIEWNDPMQQESLPYNSLESFCDAVRELFSKKVSSKVVITPFVDIDQEMELSIRCNRQTGMIDVEVSRVLLGEKRVHKESVLRNKKLYSFQKTALFSRLSLAESLRTAFYALVDGLLSLYYTFDLVLLEIKPLAIIYNGGLEIAKIRIETDDAALFRQPELCHWYQKREQIVPIHHYQGCIGCIAEGEALLQATVDALVLRKQKPGVSFAMKEGADEESVARAFQALGSCDGLKVILVNMFAGCSKVGALLESMTHVHIPVVVRLEAISLQEAKEFLEHSKSRIRCTDSFEEALLWAADYAGERYAHTR